MAFLVLFLVAVIYVVSKLTIFGAALDRFGVAFLCGVFGFLVLRPFLATMLAAIFDKHF